MHSNKKNAISIACGFLTLGFRGLALLTAISLTACGGGGGGGDGSRSYTIGGTVSGLIGSVVLQIGGLDNLTVTANGSYTFPTTVASGDSYAVTVGTQPEGQTCTAANGAGTARANVTNVTVVCTLVASAYFLPFVATPRGAPTSSNRGLFAIPSSALTTAPMAITDQAVNVLAFSMQYELTGTGSVSAAIPSAIIYTTDGAAGGDHVWAVDLDASSNLTPRQLSSLSFPTPISNQYCMLFSALKDLNDPGSEFVILGRPSDPNFSCGTGAASYHYVLVHLADTATTAPVDLPALSAVILPIYHADGILAGLYMVDSDGNLNFYADETFANPTLLLTGIHGISPSPTTSTSPFGELSGNPTYSFVNVGRQDNTTGLYRVDDSGAISGELYTFEGEYGYGIVNDANNYYFADTANYFTGLIQHIAKVPLDGSTVAQVLYTNAPPTTTGEGPFVILGVTNGRLILERALIIHPISGARSSDIQSLAVASPSTPAVLASFDNHVNAFMVADDVYILRMSSFSSGGSIVFSYSTEILNAGGTVVQPMLANSMFMNFSGRQTFGMQVRDVTDAGGQGGGSINVVDPQNVQFPAPSRLALSSGAAFTLPAETGFAFTVAVSPTIGFGGNFGPDTGAAAVYDISKGLIVPVAIPDASIAFPWAPF